mgnify:CR=1 FL=1
MKVTIKELAEDYLLNNEKIGTVEANLFIKYAKAGGSAKQVGQLPKRDKQRGRCASIFEIKDKISFNLTLKNPPVEEVIPDMALTVTKKATETAKKKAGTKKPVQGPSAVKKGTPKKNPVKNI